MKINSKTWQALAVIFVGVGCMETYDSRISETPSLDRDLPIVENCFKAVIAEKIETDGKISSLLYGSGHCQGHSRPLVDHFRARGIAISDGGDSYPATLEVQLERLCDSLGRCEDLPNGKVLAKAPGREDLHVGDFKVTDDGSEEAEVSLVAGFTLKVEDDSFALFVPEAVDQQEVKALQAAGIEVVLEKKDARMMVLSR